MKRIAALFDADGTLFAAQMGRGLMKYAQKNGMRGMARLYYASLAPNLVFSKLKMASAESFQRATIERMPWLVKGYDEGQGREAFRWVIEEYLLPTSRPQVVQRLEEHLAQGHQVAIVSGILMPCLEVLGERLGVTNLIGTRIEVQAGRYTGRAILPVVKGDDKGRLARQYFVARGVEIDWAASYAYGDSFSDRSILDLVGHPAAVYPDAKLRELAQAQGWEIIE